MKNDNLESKKGEEKHEKWLCDVKKWGVKHEKWGEKEMKEWWNERMKMPTSSGFDFCNSL